jgi:hypothetical protein
MLKETLDKSITAVGGAKVKKHWIIDFRKHWIIGLVVCYVSASANLHYRCLHYRQTDTLDYNQQAPFLLYLLYSKCS